jgi:hypothetical protein
VYRQMVSSDHLLKTFISSPFIDSVVIKFLFGAAAAIISVQNVFQLFVYLAQNCCLLFISLLTVM